MKFLCFRAMAVGVLSAFLSIGPIAASQAADSPDKRHHLDTFVQAFGEMALRVDGRPATELARWTGPIYLAIADDPGMERIGPQVETLVRSLASIARVVVERVPFADARRNFVVRAGGRESNGTARCLSTVDWDDRGQILSVDVRLNLSNVDRLTRCATHEVVHGFGLRAHPDQAFSVLSYRHAGQAHLTETDHVVLRTLYDPRLPATGSMERVARIACEIIAQGLQMAPEAASPACAGRPAPSRRGLFAAIGGQRENFGQ